MQRRSLLAVPLASLAAGCASTPSTSLQTTVASPAGLKSFKRAYVEVLGEDEFHVGPAIMAELSDMGLEAFSGLPSMPDDADLLVRVSSEGGWDFSRYLQSLQLQFLSAKEKKLVASTYFRSNGGWMGARDLRLKAVFNDLRSKLGLPLSRQFR